PPSTCSPRCTPLLTVKEVVADDLGNLRERLAVHVVQLGQGRIHLYRDLIDRPVDALLELLLNLLWGTEVSDDRISHGQTSPDPDDLRKLGRLQPGIVLIPRVPVGDGAVLVLPAHLRDTGLHGQVREDPQAAKPGRAVAVRPDPAERTPRLRVLAALQGGDPLLDHLAVHH